MDAYSLDLRKKIIEAKERGMPTSEVAKTFGVGLSTVKRYAATARQGRPLAPKKHPGSKPKIDEGARRLLEADLEEREERPAATLPERREFLRRTCGVSVSDSTVSRMLKRLGWTRKRSVGANERDEFFRAAWRVMVAAATPSPSVWSSSRRWAPTLLSDAPVCLVAPWRAGAREGATQLGCGRHALSEHEVRGMGPCLAVEGPTTEAVFEAVFEAYLERALAPSLCPGQVVVMDNLSSHKGFSGARAHRDAGV